MRRMTSESSSRVWARNLISLARINEAGELTGFLYRDNDVSAASQGWANHATLWAVRFFIWNRACAWPIITSNAFLKRRKEFKQFLRAANCAPLLALTPQLASCD